MTNAANLASLARALTADNSNNVTAVNSPPASDNSLRLATTQFVKEQKGGLIRTLRYSRVGGVQVVSIDGGANTSTGATTYTPSSDMEYVEVEVQGAGGAGGGAINPAAAQVCLGAPGSAGSFAASIIQRATIGASQTIAVGAPGAPAPNAVGGNGGDSTFGSLITAPGGGGGALTASVAPPYVLGTFAGTSAPTGGNALQAVGAPGGPTISISATSIGSYGGQGGGTRYGAATPFTGANLNGTNAANYGAGGSGVVVTNGFGPALGGAGFSGVIFIREYA